MLAVLAVAGVGWLWDSPGDSSSSPDASEGTDMSALFAKFRTCQACVEAGYGWCPNRRKCGGFATEGCGEGENYVAPGEPYSGPSSAAAASGQPSGGTDMRATFARYRTCTACIGAGYGWCTIQRKCGGFANRECGEGERYVAHGLPADRAKPSRNGLWEPKAAREASHEAAKPASASVDPASPSSGAAASMLHASPVRPQPSPPPTGGTDMRATFAKLRSCESCVSAGYGWCTIQRKCGGFANRECGEGERYVAAGEEGARESAPSPEAAAEAPGGAEDDEAGLEPVSWATFKKEVMDYEGVVAIQFFAPWCGHCKAMKPAWRAAAAALQGSAKLLVVDATKQTKLAKRFEVSGYPSIKLFGRNKRIFPTAYEGPRTADALISAVRELIAEQGAATPAAAPSPSPSPSPSAAADAEGDAPKPEPKPKPSPASPPPSRPKRPPATPPPAMPRMLRRHELEAMAPSALVNKVLELQDELKMFYEL